MLSELIRKPTGSDIFGHPVKQSSSFGSHAPLIEVINSTDGRGEGEDGEDGEDGEYDEDGEDGEDGEKDDRASMSDGELPSETQLEKQLALEAEAEQQLPPPLDALLEPCVKYGFNEKYHGLFVGLQDAQVVACDPEIADAESRRAGRLAAEVAAFDADHYMADFMLDAEIEAALAYLPWWLSPESKHLQDGIDTEGYPSVPQTERECRPSNCDADPAGRDCGESSDGPVCRRGRSDSREQAFSWLGIGTEAQQFLLQLPRQELLMDRRQQRRALCGLVDLLYTYCYDVRTTGGDPTVESGWTIRTLSSLLSHFDTFDTVAEAAVACVRRSLCYPLFRHWGLAMGLLADVARILELGRNAVLRALIECRCVLQRTVEYGYLLNKAWIDDYCMWVQQQPPRRITRLVTLVRELEFDKDALGWPLSAYEELAVTPEGEIE